MSYNSSHTGSQIDEAVQRVVDSGATEQDPLAKISDVEAAQSAGATTLFAPASVTVSAGSIVTGNLTSILTDHDGLILELAEAAGANPLTVVFTFENVNEFNQIAAHLRYAGSASHEWVWEAQRVSDSGWDTLSTVIGPQSGLTWFAVPVALADNYINAGTVSIRWRHVSNGISTHRLYVDFVALIASLSGAGLPTEVSQSEAEAGTESAIRSWSPLRVAQAIAALGGGDPGGGLTYPLGRGAGIGRIWVTKAMRTEFLGDKNVGACVFYDSIQTILIGTVVKFEMECNSVVEYGEYTVVDLDWDLEYCVTMAAGDLLAKVGTEYTIGGIYSHPTNIRGFYIAGKAPTSDEIIARIYLDSVDQNFPYLCYKEKRASDIYAGLPIEAYERFVDTSLVSVSDLPNYVTHPMTYPDGSDDESTRYGVFTYSPSLSIVDGVYDQNSTRYWNNGVVFFDDSCEVYNLSVYDGNQASPTIYQASQYGQTTVPDLSHCGAVFEFDVDFICTYTAPHTNELVFSAPHGIPVLPGGFKFALLDNTVRNVNIYTDDAVNAFTAFVIDEYTIRVYERNGNNLNDVVTSNGTPHILFMPIRFNKFSGIPEPGIGVGGTLLYMIDFSFDTANPPPIGIW